MTAPAVVARALTKRFGRTAALRDVSFEVAPGTTLAVLGRNGAGKSTLLRLLAGLARPSTGTLEVAGHPATHASARARTGYVGHATGLYPALTARENLLFAARLHGLPDAGARADAALAREGLAAVAQRPAGGFSRGMAQRLAIARGLLHEPEVVLLDEPFTGLDGAAARRLAERLAALRSDGRTVVWVTHDVQRGARGSDAVLVLVRGRIALYERSERVAPGRLEPLLDVEPEAATTTPGERARGAEAHGA